MALAAGALALGSLLLTASGGAITTTASATAPLLHWDAGMLPAGATSGLPAGPVGMRATAHGARFTSGAHVRLGLVAGDTTKTTALCASVATTTTATTASTTTIERDETSGAALATTPTATIIGEATVQRDGTFDESFYWPKAAGKVGAGYSLCAYNASTGRSLGARDDGPFTVLAESAPIVMLSRRSAGPGNSITISGRSFVPPQSVTVTVRPHDGSAPLVTKKVTSSGRTTGTFSATLALPSTATAGSYTIAATAQNGRIGATAPGALTIAGTAHATTPAPTVNPKPTAGAHATPGAATPGTTATPGATATAGTTPGTNATPGATTTPGAQATTGTTPGATAAPTQAGQSTATAGANSTGTNTAPVAAATTATGNGPDWAVIGLAITVFILLVIIGILLALLLMRRDRDGWEDAPLEWILPFSRRRRARPSRPAPQNRATPMPEAIPAAPRARSQEHGQVYGEVYDAAPHAAQQGEWRPYAPGVDEGDEYGDDWQAQPPARDPLEGWYYAPPADEAPPPERYEAPYAPQQPSMSNDVPDAQHTPSAPSTPYRSRAPFVASAPSVPPAPFVPVGAGLDSAPYQPRAGAPGQQPPMPASEPASDGDPSTWVWGADMPYGPYAAARPGAPAGHDAAREAALDAAREAGHDAAPSGSPASDVFGLPGPWGLKLESVPTDLTLPSWRGMPPGADRAAGQPPSDAPRRPGAEDVPHALGAGDNPRR